VIYEKEEECVSLVRIWTAYIRTGVVLAGKTWWWLLRADRTIGTNCLEATDLFYYLGNRRTSLILICVQNRHLPQLG
jgi:hypothetical protein